jgi:phosphoglycerate kinase
MDFFCRNAIALAIIVEYKETTMPFRNIKDLDVKGHRVFLRADLNVPIKDGVIKDATRIVETMATLKYLLDNGASVVMCSHMGRPEGIGFEAAYSMAPVAAWLEDKEGIDCRLASAVTGEEVEREAAGLEPGQVLLLENLRFDKGETKNKPEFCAALARLADTYVNDAFGSAHRAHASVAGVVPSFPKDRIAAGFLMEKELKALGKVTHNPEKPLVAVMGGAKVSDKIDLIRNFLGKADAILIGGAMSYTLLKTQGVSIGKSLCEEDKLELAKEILAEAKTKGTRLLLPLDHVVAPEFKADSPATITNGLDIPEGQMGLDIGPETVAAYLTEIKNAKTLIWNGPMGVFEMDAFAAGTLTVAEEMAAAAKGGAFVLVGGGDSVAAVNKAKVASSITHISTGGGASLEFLSGIVLPGVHALEL